MSIPEATRRPSAVAQMLIGQLFAGFVRHIFEPDLDVDVIELDSAHALVAALFPAAR